METIDLTSLEAESGFTEEALFERIDNSAVSSEKITAPIYSYWRSVARVFFKKRINIVVLVALAIFWSIKQITIDNNVATMISWTK